MIRPVLPLLILTLGSEAAIRSTTGLVIPQHGGGVALSAEIFAPDASRGQGPYPVISMLPGGGATMTSVEWAAQRLAADGYVVCITLPERSTESEYAISCQSGIDFLASSANPYLAESDNSRVGICGWSLGGRSLTKVQEEDTRVDCLVSWDNLAISETGDGGSPAGQNAPNPLRRPRVPAMGQASENGFMNSEVKTTAWKWWRLHQVPVAEITFANSNHFWWSASSTAAKYDQSHHYTLAWFDRWLKNDPTAISRLFATSVGSTPVGTLLSSRFRSAIYVDGQDIADLRAHLVTGPGTGSVAPARMATWVASGGDTGVNDVARALDCDAAGNVYTVGSFSGTVNLRTNGGSSSGNLTSSGAEDIFVVKNDPTGGFVWSRRHGSTGADFAYDVHVDGSGRVILCGTFQGTVPFGAFTLVSPGSLTSSFTAILGSTGDVIWAGATGVPTAFGGVYAGEVAAGADGGFYVIGSFIGGAQWESTSIPTSGANSRGFVARYAPNGAFLWVAAVSGTDGSAARGVAIAGNGDILVTGQFSGTATFGPHTLVSEGNTDAWLARLTGSGTWLSVRQAGGAGEDYGRGVAMTSDGYAVSGSFSGGSTPVFGAGAVSSDGAKDVFAVKFDTHDNPVWLRRIGGNQDDEGAEIAVDRADNVLLCGSFAGTVIYAGTSITSGGARDILVARLAADGSPMWLAGSTGDAGDDVGYACALDREGNAYFSGFFQTVAPVGFSVCLSPTAGTSPGHAEIIYGRIPGDAGLWRYAGFRDAAGGESGSLADWTADPDNDQLSNLLEYALGLDPLEPTAGPWSSSVTGGQLQFTCLRARSDVRYLVETSPDLSPGSWTSSGVSLNTGQVGGLVTGGVPVSGHACRFLRLRVEFP